MAAAGATDVGSLIHDIVGISRRAQELQKAIVSVPREHFLPKSLRGVAYTDKNIELAEGRYLMRPRAFAKLMQAANVRSDDVVLVLGCGTGYSAAVMGQLADSVVALECDEVLADKATANLEELEIDNVAVVTGPLCDGLAGQGPFNVIFVDGALAERSPQIEQQLAEGGRLVVILQNGPIGRGTLIKKDADRYPAVEVFDASVYPLPGFEKDRSFVF